MDESFKIICRLIEKQSITYSEAYELLKDYFNSKKAETDNFFTGKKFIDAPDWAPGGVPGGVWCGAPYDVKANDDNNYSIKCDKIQFKPWHTKTTISSHDDYE